MSVNDRIRDSYSALTESEKKIADYFLDHGEQLASYSAKQMAEVCHTSAPTIIRFARTLGYSGLSQLKVDLLVTKKEEIPDLTKELEQDEKPSDLIKATYSHRLGNLQRTEELIDEEVVSQSADTLEKASCIYLIGIGGSGNVCMDLYHKLNRIGYRAIFNTDAHIQLASLAGIREGDAVIAISYSGETASVLESVKVAKEQGATVIGISHLGNTSLRALSDINFFLPVQEDSLRAGAIASRDASLMITDIVYLTLFSRHLDEHKETLMKTRKWTGRLS